MSGHWRRCKAGVVWTFGIVEILMLCGGFAQDPKPTADILGGILMVVSSRLVSLLVAGDVDDRANWGLCPWRFECSRPSMRVNCSSMSLSPASSLMPGSR